MINSIKLIVRCLPVPQKGSRIKVPGAALPATAATCDTTGSIVVVPYDKKKQMTSMVTIILYNKLIAVMTMITIV